jgi:predicted acetyltransferase
MFRITDVKPALEMLPIPTTARGELALEVDDPVLAQNARTYRVSAREGRLRVAPYRGLRAPRLKVPVDVLAQLYTGALSPLAAAEAGLVTSSQGAAEIADGWFRARPAFLYSFNLF